MTVPAKDNTSPNAHCILFSFPLGKTVTSI
jgi:hypothetical protein